MAYWLDDGFDTWPQVVRAGSPAVGLYVRCGAWIARNTQDGDIPAEVVAMYGTPEWAKRLVDVGLWETDGQGYRDLFYFEHGNPTADVVKKRKADAAERQRRFREGSRKRVTRDKTRDSRGSNSARDGGSHDSPALPLPLREGRASGPPAPQADGPEPEDRTPHWRDLAGPGELDERQLAVNAAGAAQVRQQLNGHKSTGPAWPSGSAVLGALPDPDSDDRRPPWT